MALNKKTFAADIKQHHVSRNGGDPRALAKKEGAGAFNWGRAGDENEDANQEMSSSPPPESKLRMANRTQFEAAQKANKK
ncbi:hypothetical protein GGI03_006163 [Coemansia sp. RSA 2337]|nr:hypothetical protein LPJ71_001158 [Coemansia sp. S17]KAJ2023695.1 hypothetical protein H4S03_009267 [Coemansia sp. S3946]KAJ2050970.1 hypothetical protein GGI08_005368 [Coemansia sp. S2]KAJ2068380.1 hypothetical protein GGH13_004940 [Coemansia sp. S155-1]KAJ2095213.1 hypothetical protein GGI09_004989 [Coemansia sp. S100]KAJ2109049.1 hypothetical protein IW146_006548 [Coemansia sp. RSA 922]KAJ2343671.1 hypothetical protein GGH92_004810 [Coemansia sp. RSA 2673]KAJ2457206.1 hypothetical prot